MTTAHDNGTARAQALSKTVSDACQGRITCRANPDCDRRYVRICHDWDRTLSMKPLQGFGR